jgi:hypothetical protein
MSFIITSFIAFTLTLISLLIWSIREEKEGWVATFIVSLAIFGIFGWGVFLSCVTETTKVEDKQAKVLEIIKGKHITVVSTPENYNKFYTGYESDMIDSTTKFIWRNTYKYNYYGFENGTITEFIAINDTSKSTVPEVKVER